MTSGRNLRSIRYPPALRSVSCKLFAEPDKTGPDQTGPDQTGPDQSGQRHPYGPSPLTSLACFYFEGQNRRTIVTGDRSKMSPAEINPTEINPSRKHAFTDAGA